MIKNDDILEILLTASNIIRDYYDKGFEINIKNDSSPVTEVDIKINDFLKNKLTKLLPKSGWLSEESADNLERLNKEFVWIVDPIDGTSKLIKKIPEFSISVALVRNGIPVISSIINPITLEYGISNKWDNLIFSNHFNKNNYENDDMSIIVSSSEMSRGNLDIFINDKYPLKKIGSVAYKLLRIAGGKDNIYITLSPKAEWDICAGIGLVLDSGKSVIRFDKKENIFNQKDLKVSKGFIAGTKKDIENFKTIFSFLENF
ncbi:MAG: 3'(2'),5'-bisphosphate nucleotidase CysQ [Candidatus Sericytochromatia bacterium]|nr:MAG: 3'(2'),5'-bisphosphate nucleotidase CysQ [Candidatus Sericytochromatia bacterium]